MGLGLGSRVKQYWIEDRLGGGGMGVVWRARDTARDELVAIKAVANDLILDPEFGVRIKDEARRHQSLQHPNIVPVHDVFEAYGQTCIVMNLIEGQSLSAMLKERPDNRLEFNEAIGIVEKVLDALNYAHLNRIVHRDVKPSNVMVDQSGGVWLLDFGIAMAMGEKRRTRTGQTIGTPAYMSPEQISNPRTVDHRTDVYSVGCMLYELVTGRPPFLKNTEGVTNSDFAIQRAHVHNSPVHPSARVPSIPDDLDEIIMAALKKNPEERIPGCGEFLRLLQQVGANSNGRGGTPFLKDWRVRIAILGVLAVLLLIFVFFLSQ